jgi:limonene-1,2-epoxide hydrolase
MDVKRLFSAIDSMDTDAFASFLSEDVVFRFGGFPLVKGRENVKTTVNQFFSSIKSLSHKITKTHPNEKNHSIIIEGEVTYTRKDNSKVTIPFANIFGMEKDKISTYLIYIDISPLYAA